MYTTRNSKVLLNVGIPAGSAYPAIENGQTGLLRLGMDTVLGNQRWCCRMIKLHSCCVGQLLDAMLRDGRTTACQCQRLNSLTTENRAPLYAVVTRTMDTQMVELYVDRQMGLMLIKLYKKEGRVFCRG